MAERAGGRWLGRSVVAYLGLLAALWIAIGRWSALGPPGAGAVPPLDPVAAGRLLASLRAGLSRPPAAAPAGRPDGRAWLWCGGREVAASPVWLDGERAVAPGLGAGLPGVPSDAAARAGCRLRLDRDQGRAPILSTVDPLFALSLVPGIDGLGLDFAGREVVLGPDQLLAAGALAGYRPLPGVDFELGLDTRAALVRLALAVGADAATWRRTPHRLFRVRAESWVDPPPVTGAPAAPEGPPPPAVPLLRGLPPGASLSVDSLRRGGDDGARYLERHLLPSGRFEYLYDALADQVLPDADDYSFPRHAGAAWYLSQAALALGEPRFAEAAARALSYLEAHPPAGCDRPAWACVGDPGARHVDLGAASLTLLAAVEYRRATGDARFDRWARRLAAFVTMMQRKVGDFRHVYDLAGDAPDEHARLLYYSGEAAFALSRLAADAGTAPAERAALAARVDQALDWLTGDNYDYFAGGFFFGEDHWTCIAVDDAWELVAASPARERYGDFCEGFAAWLDRSRFRAGDGALAVQPDLAGSHGFTAMMPAHPTPVGSRTEALISAHRVAALRGHAAAAARIAEAVRGSLGFLLSRQIRPDGAWMMPSPAAAAGGFPMSDVHREIRIDYIQHAGSAMLRAAAVPALCGAPPPVAGEGTTRGPRD